MTLVRDLVRRFFVGAAVVVGSAQGAAFAQAPTPWVGEKGITETVQQIMDRAAVMDKPWDPASGVRMVEDFYVDRRHLPSDPGAPPVAMWPPLPGVSPVQSPFDNLPGGKDHGGLNLPQTVGTSFLATNIGMTVGFIPPDTQGAVGPDQVLVCSNGIIRVYSKAGVLGGLNASTDAFFNSVRNASTTSDPQVKYDRTSGRWFVTMINTSTPNRILIAVSSGNHITNSASFTFFQFQQDLVGTTPNADTGALADYPKTGVDVNALYIGGRMFASGSTYNGSTAWVVRKSSITGGGPIVVTPFRQIATAGGNGPYSPMGVDNDDSAATEGYVIGVDNAVFSRLVIRRISTPGGTPTISGNLNITVPTTDNSISQACLGSTANLDALDDRTYYAMMHKNRISGTTSLWTAHSIQVTAAGVAGAGGRNGTRWYQLGNLTGAPSLTQSGTLFDSAGSNPRGYWIPSCAMSGQGHVALCTSIAGATEHAEIGVSGRLRTDTSGTVQAATVAQTSSTTYNDGGSPQRWGDYTNTMLDPNDDMTFWTFQEYCDATNSWAVRAIQLKAPLPASPSSCSPPNVTQGASNVNVTVTGTSSGGTEFYDPDNSFPNHIAASVSGTGVTVNSVTFTDITHVTMNISVSGVAGTGARNVTITNPDGQQATGVGILTIDASSTCPSFSQNPGDQTVCQGSNASFTVVASGNPAPTYQWRKNTVNLTDGGSVSGSQTATLSITGAQPGDAGSYDCVATNACGSTTSNAANLTVNTAPSVTTNPTDQTARAVYCSASFSVAATGTGPLSYQWRKNTVNLTDGGAVSGSQTTTLTFNPADITDNGSTIDCVVTNACGSATSTAANYTVICVADFNGDGFVTGDDFDAFTAAFDAGDPSADVNCDGFVTGDDFDAFSAAFDAGC